MIITRAELAEHIGIPDSEDDQRLTWATAAGNSAVNHFCGRQFDKTALLSETARVFRPMLPTSAVVDDFWSTANLVVKTDDNLDGTYETTWTAADYLVEPFNRRLEDGSDTAYCEIAAVGTKRFLTGQERPSLQVMAAWGWETIPDAVHYATLIYAHKLFNRKDSPDGVVGGFQDFVARISRFEDPTVAELLAPYVRLAVVSAVA